MSQCADSPEFLQEVQVDTYYRGGDAAVRVTHKPTGLVVTVEDEPIQVLARRKALAMLAERLYGDDKLIP